MKSQESQANTLLKLKPKLRTELASNLFEKLQNRLPKFKIDDVEYYVAEGDTLLDVDQLFIYAQQREAVEKALKAASAAKEAGLGTTYLGPEINVEGQSGRLIGQTQNNKLVRWKPGTLLSYCVLKKTFLSQDKYQIVRENMELATEAWESVCGVKFEHKSDLDDSNSIRPNGVIFPVRYIDASGSFIAAAFFPNDPVDRRRIFIDPSYFTTSFDKVGVLRHELGHVLGFRHEHIRSGAPPNCPDEDTSQTINLTDYDPQSVMHYFCGQVGSQELAITEVDKEGAQKVYGPPFSSFFEIEG